MLGNGEEILTARTDITPKNVLLQLTGIYAWPTEVMYQQLGRLITDEVFKSSGQKSDLSAPKYLVVQHPSLASISSMFPSRSYS